MPKDFEKWVIGSTVDLSSTTPYYKKLWDIHRPLFAELVEDRGAYRFELKPVLFRSLIRHLDAGLRGPHHEPHDANVIAETLCHIALDFTPREASSESEISEEARLWPELELADSALFNYFGVDFERKDIAEAWRTLGKLRVPDLDGVTLQKTGENMWEPLFDRNKPDDRIQIRPTYNTDIRKLPKLTVEIEGEPVALLMHLSAQSASTRTRVDGEPAEKLWKALMHWLAVCVGLDQAAGGRPRSNQGRKAAFYHDHLGKSWSQVARIVCPLRHAHTKSCSENFRKQAEQFWKRLQSNIESLTAPRK